MNTTEIIDAMNALTVKDLEQLPSHYQCFLAEDVQRLAQLVKSFKEIERSSYVREGFQQLIKGEAVILMAEFKPLVEAGVLETFTEYSGPRCQDETEMVRLKGKETK